MKKKIVIISMLGVICLFILVTCLNLGKFLVVSDPLEKADAVVVFSGDSGARTEHGVKLYKEGYGNYLLMSGGVVYDDVTMAELMKSHAIKLGVKEGKILVENEASSTYENAIFSKDIIEEYGFKSIIVVTSDYHTKRTKLTVEKVLENTGVKIMVSSAKDAEFNIKWWTSGESVLMIISEYLKLMGYWAKGQL